MTPPVLSRDASYRRGTVMGLTAAEAFMLICFILLLLLGLWRQSSEERLAKAQEAEAFHNAFSAEERIAALTYKPRLTELGEDLLKLGDLSRIVAEADGAQQVEDAIRLYQEVKGTPPEEVATRARLLNDATLKKLAEAAVKLPDDTKRKLVDLTALESFPEIVAAVHAAPEETLEARAQNEELAAYRKTDLTPDDISRMRSTVSDLNRINDSALETGADAEPFILQGDAAIDAVADTPRWSDVDLRDCKIVRPQEGLIVVAYKAEAKRDDGPRYVAHCTSTYRRLGHDEWRVVQHQQTPPVKAVPPRSGSGGRRIITTSPAAAASPAMAAGC
ncbi:MAG: hypothetical protein JG765_2623 [Cereibacter sp.]|jgi:hypothetical protein|nr:hypothetical protein [Cereibacter sp.]